MTEITKLTQAEFAIQQAETPQEHEAIDIMLSELAEMGKREAASKEQMHKIAVTRITNYRAMGDKLDALRDAGVIHMGPKQSGTSGTRLDLPSKKRTVLADELNDWPEESDEYGPGLLEFVEKHESSEIKDLTVTGAYNAAKYYRLTRDRKEADVEAFEHPDILLFNADFRDVLPKLDPEYVSMIFTDPPYSEKYKHLYKDMAELAYPITAEGGSLITYFGHYALPDITRYFSQSEWRFWWLMALDQRHGGGRKNLVGKNVRVHWKPLLWYVKGGRWNEEFVDDMINSEAPKKEVHEWEQSTVEAEYYIEFLSEPGGWVLDPFMGSGTTGIAALNKGRKFIGIEQDEERYKKASERLSEWLKSAPTTNQKKK